MSLGLPDHTGFGSEVTVKSAWLEGEKRKKSAARSEGRDPDE